MKKEIYTDELGLNEQEEEILGVDEEIKLNHGENISNNEDNDLSDDNSDDSDTVVNASALLDYLRYELTKPEYLRIPLKFKYNGKKHSGTPLKEISSKRFIFLVNSKMKAFNLSEIEPV